jgi:hypothetical protein
MMKTKFDIGEIVMVPAKIYSISIDDGKIEYLVNAGKARIGEFGHVNMRVKEEDLVSLTDGSESIHEKLRDIIEWINSSSDHQLFIERDGKGKIVKAMLEVTRE